MDYIYRHVRQSE